MPSPRTTRTQAGKATTTDVRPPSVLFSGYLFETTGYGAASRTYISALHRAGVELSLQNRSPYGWQPAPNELCRSLVNRRTTPEFYISHSEPLDALPKLRPQMPLIILTTWESDSLPEPFVEALNKADEVWAPSRFNVEAFRRQLRAPVFQLPHAVSLPPRTLLDTASVNQACRLAADDFVFLSIATWQERKNLLGVIEAFFRAFPSEPHVKLVIKTSFAFQNAKQATNQISAMLQSRLPQIQPEEIPKRLCIFESMWPEERLEALLRRADCYISLHRGEGWCYPLFDACCAGLPVIATGYSGPMDYLDPLRHRLVRHELVHADRGDDPKFFPFTPEMRWAQPDTLQAAQFMREVYEDPASARAQAESAAGELRQKFSLSEVGRQASEHLLALRSSGFRAANASSSSPSLSPQQLPACVEIPPGMTRQNAPAAPVS